MIPHPGSALLVESLLTPSVTQLLEMQEMIELPEDDDEELWTREHDPKWINTRKEAHYGIALCHDSGYGFDGQVIGSDECDSLAKTSAKTSAKTIVQTSAKTDLRVLSGCCQSMPIMPCHDAAKPCR